MCTTVPGLFSVHFINFEIGSYSETLTPILGGPILDFLPPFYAVTCSTLMCATEVVFTYTIEGSGQLAILHFYSLCWRACVNIIAFSEVIIYRGEIGPR